MRRTAFLVVVFTLACGDAAPQTVAQRPTQSLGIASTAPMAGLRRARSDSIDGQRHSAIVEAAARVAPAVVSVNVVARQRAAPQDLFDLFLLPQPYERVVQGLGSGFIVSADGVVITNQHVVEGAERIVVTTRDGTDYPAKLLGEDPLSDIAVLKVDGHDLPTVTLGRSDDLMIGEWVVAIGNPYGYLLGNSEPSVTAGVVSALGRNLLPSRDDSQIYVGMIQTDAAINPGNSGGPLANALGEVVGVNSSILSANGGSVGLGFAIPIERAMHVANELQRYGEVRRAWVGLSVAGEDQMRAWKEVGGLKVEGVATGSPAGRAGLQAGDVLVSAGGVPMHTYLDWEAAKLDVSPGDTLALRYVRHDVTRRVVVQVEPLPTSRAERISVLGDIELVTVTSAVQQERHLPVDHGALIYKIGGRAQQVTGLRPGDVILQINRAAVSTAADVRDAFQRSQGGSAIRVLFVRGTARGVTDFYVR